MKPTFFRSGREFRTWLEKHHKSAGELLLGFYKTKAKESGMSYPEALDEALCFGWIDGVRTGRDAVSYTVRFTPRKAKSTWSLVNVRRVEELTKLGRMTASGANAFAAREEKRSGIYSYESKHEGLSSEFKEKFKADAPAWTFFSAQAPWYQRTAGFLVMNAKKEETRLKRLALLIEASRNQLRISQLDRKVAGEKPGT